MSLDELSFVLFVVCVIVYIGLMVRGNRPGSRTGYRVIIELYANWVESRFRDRNLNVAVQALRNIIMGNSIYASALLLFLGMLAGLYQSDAFSSAHCFFGLEGVHVNLVKISLNALITIFCLLNFMMAIRMMNRLTLLFCSFPQEVKPEEVKELRLMQETFDSGQNQLMLGNRGIFYLVPAMTWLIHPLAFMATTVVVTIYLVFFHDLQSVQKT